LQMREREQVWSSLWSFPVENTRRDLFVGLAALEPATSWMRTRGSDASPALTGRPDYSTSLDAAKRHPGGCKDGAPGGVRSTRCVHETLVWCTSSS
jgi:hypothetical protein